jgi:hypothetical protein
MAWFRRGQDYFAVIAPYLGGIDVQSAPHTVERQLERVPPPAHALLAAHLLRACVRSEGFAQFFWNPVGVLAPEALDAFFALGLPAAAAQIEQAMRVLGDPYPRACEARRRKLEGLWDRTPETRVMREALAAHTRAFRGALRWGRFTRAANRYARLT